MLALIPAKSFSSRLKNKNIKLLNKKPLIYYTIKAALKSKKVKRVVVSTDSKKISKISMSYGAEVPFLRPKKYSKKLTTVKEVCKHAIKFLENKEKKKIEEVLILQPTSPLRKPSDIDKAISIFKKNKTNYLTSLSKTKPFEWFFYKKNKKKFSQISKKKIKNSQDLRQTYILNGSIYILKRDLVFGKKINLNSIIGIEIPTLRSIDIDDINDFLFVDRLIKRKKNV